MRKLVSTFIIMFPMLAVAEPIKSFDEVWKALYEKSHKQNAVKQEMELNELSLDRAQRHWLPRVYVTGQWFNTNDPGQVFINKLGQRSIEQTDFIPQDLNRPERETFGMGTLGVDLPLYEGGMKSNQSNMYQALVKASELEMKAKRSEEFSELARHYGNLILLEKNESTLLDTQKNLERIIASYQVGAQSNPVGYSGLLGLKGVKNRIEGMLNQYTMKIKQAKNWISTKSELPESWSANTNQEITEYLSENLSSKSGQSSSTQLLAQEMKLSTLDDMKDMEKARFLPKVGLFAQNNLYQGSRDTATAQAFGLYLQWDLFNSDSYGRLGEASAKALAERSKLMAFKQEEQIALQDLRESKETLEGTIKLLKDSEKLLAEQASTSMRLFRSGLLNALQLAEVINRRVDLIENKLQAETQYLDVWSRLYQLNN